MRYAAGPHMRLIPLSDVGHHGFPLNYRTDAVNLSSCLEREKGKGVNGDNARFNMTKCLSL